MTTKRKYSPPARCYCGSPALITVGLWGPATTWGPVGRGAYCLKHLADAIVAIAQIRLELEEVTL